MRQDCQEAATIARLTLIFETVLKRAPIDPGQSFFELGGDSILAITLLIEIENAFARELSITSLYDAPSVNGLADLLTGAAAEKFSPLVVIKPGEGSPPLFIIHGIGGNVIELLDLGRRIQSEAPVYAVQAVGLDGAQLPLVNVEDMASAYLDAVRTVAPRGPYLLAGYSFGGLVALEMAVRLRNCGQKVGMLALVDSYPHPRLWPPRARLDVFSRLASQWLARTGRRSLQDGFAGLSQLLQKSLNYLSPQRHPDIGRHWPAETSPNLQRVRDAGFAAWQSYTPPAYPDEILFIHATVFTYYPTNPVRAFRGRPLTTFKVNAAHDEIVRSKVADLAMILSDAVAHALDPTTPPDSNHRRSGRPAVGFGQPIKRSASSRVRGLGWMRGLGAARSARVAPK